MRHAILAAILALSFAAVSRAQSVDLVATTAPVENRIPFTVAKGEINVPLLLVQVTINGKPAVLIFDSGAMALGLTPELVKGVRPLGKVNHSGVGGGTISEVVAVDLQLGTETFRHVIAETNDLKAVNSNLGTHVDGFLGEEILSQYKRVSIDYENKIIVLSR